MPVPSDPLSILKRRAHRPALSVHRLRRPPGLALAGPPMSSLTSGPPASPVGTPPSAASWIGIGRSPHVFFNIGPTGQPCRYTAFGGLLDWRWPVLPCLLKYRAHRPALSVHRLRRPPGLALAGPPMSGIADYRASNRDHGGRRVLRGYRTP